MFMSLSELKSLALRKESTILCFTEQTVCIYIRCFQDRDIIGQDVSLRLKTTRKRRTKFFHFFPTFRFREKSNLKILSGTRLNLANSKRDRR